MHEKSGRRQEESPFQGPILTAVRQGTEGTAEDNVLWQQASRGSASAAVHEAVLTVAAEQKHSPALQEQLQPPPLSSRLSLTLGSFC